MRRCKRKSDRTAITKWHTTIRDSNWISAVGTHKLHQKLRFDAPRCLVLSVRTLRQQGVDFIDENDCWLVTARHRKQGSDHLLSFPYLYTRYTFTLYMFKYLISTPHSAQCNWGNSTRRATQSLLHFENFAIPCNVAEFMTLKICSKGNSSYSSLISNRLEVFCVCKLQHMDLACFFVIILCCC